MRCNSQARFQPSVKSISGMLILLSKMLIYRCIPTDWFIIWILTFPPTMPSFPSNHFSGDPRIISWMLLGEEYLGQSCHN